MTTYQDEVQRWKTELDAEAARLLRDGYCTPADALIKASENIQQRRQHSAGATPTTMPDLKSILSHD